MANSSNKVKRADVELLLNEIQDTKNQLSALTSSLIEVQTSLKIFIEQNKETKTALSQLDSDFKDKLSPLYTKVDNQSNTISTWKGAINILAAGCVLMPLLIVGVFVTFNPNNSKLEELENKFNQHVYDPKLHHNIVNYVDTNFVKKVDLK